MYQICILEWFLKEKIKQLNTTFERKFVSYMWYEVKEGVSAQSSHCKGHQEAQQEVEANSVHEWDQNHTN